MPLIFLQYDKSYNYDTSTITSVSLQAEYTFLFLKFLVFVIFVLQNAMGRKKLEMEEKFCNCCSQRSWSPKTDKLLFKTDANDVIDRFKLVYKLLILKL